jgi:hypothetical protein
MFAETRITKMLLFDNIFAIQGRPVFQQLVGILVGSTCAPFFLLCSFFIRMKQVDCMHERHRKKEKKLARSLISHSAIHRRCAITEYFPIFVTMFLPYRWTWSKGYHRYSCFVPWPTPIVTNSVDQCWEWNFTIKDFFFDFPIVNFYLNEATL